MTSTSGPSAAVGSLLQRWRRLILAAWWAGVAAVIVASLRPEVSLPDVPQSDKIAHLLAYAGLAAIPVLVDFRIRQSLLPALILLLGVGAAVELAQTAMAIGRDGSLADAAANTAGVVLGGVIAHRLRARLGL